MRFSFFVILSLFLSVALLAQKPELGLPIGHSDAILAVDFSPDGEYILTGSRDRTVKLWTRNGRVVRTIQVHAAPVEVVKFSPKGNYFISQDRGETFLWSIYGEQIAKFGIRKEYNPRFLGSTRAKIYESTICFSPDEKRLLLYGEDGKPKLYFIKNGRSKKIPNTNSNAFAFSPNGNQIISQVEEQLILFNGNGKKIKTLPKAIIQNYNKTTDDRQPNVIFIPGMEAIAVGYSTDDVAIYDLDGNEIKYFGHRGLIPGRTMVSFSAMTYDVYWSRLNISNTKKYWSFETTRVDSLWDASDFPNLKPVGINWRQAGEDIHLVDFSYNDEYLLFRVGYNQEGIVTDFTGKVQFAVKDLVGWNPGQEMLPKMPHISFPMAFAPDSNQVLVGYNNGTAALMDMDGKVLQVFDRGPLNKVLNIEYTAGGEKGKILQYKQLIEQRDSSLVLGKVESLEQIFDLKNGAVLQQQAVDTTGILNIDNERKSRAKTVVSRDGTYHIYGEEDPDVQLEDFLNPGTYFSMTSGQIAIFEDDNVLAEFTLSHSVNNLGLSPDNRLLYVSSSYENTPVYIVDFQRILEKAKTEGVNEPIIYAGQEYGRRTNFLDRKSALTCVVDSLPDLAFRSYFLDFSTKSEQFLFTSFRCSEFTLFDREDRSSKIFKGHRLDVKGAKFFKDEEFILSWSDDYSLKVWKTATGEELATMFFLNENDWVVTTPSGLFDATDGAKEMMYYVVDLEIIDIEQLEERFFSKGLLNKLLGFSPLGLREVAGFDKIELYPKVEAEIVNDTLKIRLKNQGGGIGKTTIFLNGKERIEEANPLPNNGQARDSVIAVPLSDYFKYVQGHPDSLNTITIRAYNEEGWLRSRPYNLEFKSQKAAPKGEGDTGDAWQGFSGNPNFYGVVIGTNKYSDESLELSFADQDAAAMAVALQEISQELYGQSGNVEITCLSTTPIDSSGLVKTPIPWKVSSKENIKAIFEDLATRAQAKDVLVVYFSGHGLATGTGEKTQFYYLTKDLTSKGLQDPAIRDKYSISSTELTKWMNAVPAAKGVVILDACNSGAALDAFSNSSSKNLSEGAFEAINRMKYRTGTFLIAGSAPDKLSFESKEFGQGLLTYAILKGMLDAFVTKREGKFVDVVSLFEYACNTVPILAESIDGIQRPMIGTPKGKGSGSFDIGMITDQVKIPVGSQNEIITRGVFLDSSSLQDELGLIDAFEKRMRGEADKGTKAKFIFMDANTYKNAYSVSGIYVQKEGKIHLQANLFQDKVMVKKLDLPPSRSVESLARIMVLELKDYFKTLDRTN